MPIYEYASSSAKNGCDYCRNSFSLIQKLSDEPITHCPKCNAPVTKLISAPNVGASQSGFDDRAKSSGFHKLKKTGKGEYEKLY